MVAHRERRTHNVVEAVGPWASRVVRQQVVARQCIVISDINTEVPARDDIAPLRAKTVIESISRRGQRVTRRVEECAAQRNRSVESVPVRAFITVAAAMGRVSTGWFPSIRTRSIWDSISGSRFSGK